MLAHDPCLPHGCFGFLLCGLRATEALPQAAGVEGRHASEVSEAGKATGDGVSKQVPGCVCVSARESLRLIHLAGLAGLAGLAARVCGCVTCSGRLQARA